MKTNGKTRSMWRQPRLVFKKSGVVFLLTTFAPEKGFKVLFNKTQPNKTINRGEMLHAVC